MPPRRRLADSVGPFVEGYGCGIRIGKERDYSWGRRALAFAFGMCEICGYTEGSECYLSTGSFCEHSAQIL